LLPEYPRPSSGSPRRPPERGLLALLVLQAGATAVVLAALPYQLFQLDRYTFIKELVLLVAGTTAALLCLAGAKRLTIFLVDALLAAYLGLSLISALAASNGWLAARALRSGTTRDRPRAGRPPGKW